jgi:hypothetical protein
LKQRRESATGGPVGVPVDVRSRVRISAAPGACAFNLNAIIPRVSYDLAVWEGEPPASDEAGGLQFRSLYERYIETDEPQPPSNRIRAYASALLDRYPDISDEAGPDSPWSTAPLINEAVGPIMYFPMVWSRCH